jgi:hypothetical protein
VAEATNQSSFSRYVAGRLRSRIVAATSGSMTIFILGGAAGGEISSIRMWAAGVMAFALFVARITKAIFDCLFEAIGFLLGRLVFRLPREIRLLTSICGTAWILYLLWHQAWWFAFACLTLLMFDLFAAIGHGLHREPRLLLMPYKGFLTVSVTFWGWTTGWVLAILAFIFARRAFVFLLDGLTISATEAVQEDRDLRTAQLFEQLKNGRAIENSPERIILYLRPFAVTGSIKQDEGEFFETVDGTARQDEGDPGTEQWRRTTLPVGHMNVGIGENASLFEQNSDMELVLEHALHGAGHFIALGRPGEALGAGRLLTTEAEWRNSVTLLIEAASLCIVIPSAQPGTQWELRHIVQNGHLEKCCILMPPAFGKASSANEWQAARAALADVLSLPEYQPNGGMFRYRTVPGVDPEAPVLTRTPNSACEALALTVQALFPELPKWQVEAPPAWIQIRTFGGMKFSLSSGDNTSRP